MGTIVRLKVNRQAGLTAQSYKEDAAGIPDEYGNPFRLIRLRWIQNPKHKNADYAKTRGFEDAVLSKDTKTGGIKITYRQNGSIMWERRGGMGAFMGETPQTPTNMRLLASHYGDKLWMIVDNDIREIVEKMYLERRKGESSKLKEFNDTRIAMMHTSQHDFNKDDIKPPEIPLDVERQDIAEQNRLNKIEETNLNQRKLALDEKERAITERSKDLIGEGSLPVMYQKEWLDTQKLFALRKICKSIGAKWADVDKKDTLIQSIMDKQTGNIAAVDAKMASIGSLDS